MTRRRMVVAAAVIGLLVAGSAALPAAIGRIDFFRIHSVEVHGLVHLEAVEIARQLDIAADASILTDLSSIESVAAALPAVRRAAVSRRWPGTIVVKLEEAVPVALGRVGDRLVVIDDRAAVLPYPPYRIQTPLPLAQRDSALAALLGRLRLADPDWYAALDRAVIEDGMARLRSDDREIQLEVSSDLLRLRELVAVRNWLERDRIEWAVIDARFRGRVFVRKVAV